MIGGKNQTGKWKLDARYNKKDLVLRIQKIARLRARIRLYQMDAGEFIENVLPRLPNETLIYLDPPYYVKGEGLYQHFYQHEDHVRIARLVREKIRQPWMVSYDNHQEIRALYSGYRTHTYSLQYSAQDRYAGSEVMVFSRQLRLPPGGDLEG
jgi:DNA adenine methylase